MIPVSTAAIILLATTGLLAIVAEANKQLKKIKEQGFENWYFKN